MKKYTLLIMLDVALCLLTACAPTDMPYDALEIEMPPVIDSDFYPLEMDDKVYSEIRVRHSLNFAEEAAPTEAVMRIINEDIAAETEAYVEQKRAEEAPLYAANDKLKFEHDVWFVDNGASADIVCVMMECPTYFSGESQPIYNRYGLVYDAKTGERLHLADYIGADYEEYVVAQIYRRISEAGELELYYPDLQRLLLKYLDPVRGWYPGGNTDYVRIVYQPYQIGPVLSAIWEFPIEMPDKAD